jgi:L-amino acid N-acyltransferase
MRKILAIRAATLKDVGGITEIYNDAILNTVASFDTQPKTLKEQQAWFKDHDDKHPIIIAEQEGQIIGWASLSRWSDRCAYSNTAEVSLYIAKEHRGKGIGRQLLKAIMKEGQQKGLHTIISRIVAGNEASLDLFKSEGFENVGVMKEVGVKFGKLLDVDIVQKIYR